MSNKKIKELDAEIAGLEIQIGKLKKQKEALQARTQWKCPSCNARKAIKSLTFRNTYYDQPFRDDWTPDSKQVLCQSCGEWKRMGDKFEKMISLFGEQDRGDLYRDRDGRTFVS